MSDDKIVDITKNTPVDPGYEHAGEPAKNLDEPDLINTVEDPPFGLTLNEMDLEAFFNLRDWLQSALEEKGAKITGAGVGMGKADLVFELDGSEFFVEIQPRENHENRRND